jgi:hypothetical protein
MLSFVAPSCDFGVVDCGTTIVLIHRCLDLNPVDKFAAMTNDFQTSSDEKKRGVSNKTQKCDGFWRIEGNIRLGNMKRSTDYAS